MIVLTTIVHVAGLTGKEITEFFAQCDDLQYQCWWPGTHLQFHTVSGEPGAVGSRVFMDEYIGRHRVRGAAIVLDHAPGKKLRAQMLWLIRLPLVLDMRFEDDDNGVTIIHEVRIGYRGIGRVFDWLFRLRHAQDFARALDAHVREEFPRLRDMLHASQAQVPDVGGGRGPKGTER